jgi:hypothetical protein
LNSQKSMIKKNISDFVQTQTQIPYDDAVIYCKKISDSCRVTFCSKGVTQADIVFTCNEARDLLDIILKIAPKDIPLQNNKDVCTMLTTMNKGITVKELSNRFISMLRMVIGGDDNVNSVIDKYAPQMPQLLLCICPTLHDQTPQVNPIPNKPVNNNDKQSPNNKKHIWTIVLPILLILSLIIATRNIWSPKARVASISMLTICAVVIIIIK